MAVMLVCGLALAAALVLAVRWRRYGFVLDSRAGEPWPVRLRGLVRLLTIGASTGMAVGALVIGPAGRLAMRLLAATSPDAQGMITEADEVVGRITVGGTIGFVIFVGLPAGLVAALGYVLVARAFPRGLLGGATYGVTLLLLLSWWLDPLRADNPDFDIVGPGWLALTVFVVTAVVTGLVIPPFAGRVDAALGEPRLGWLWWMAPIGLLTAATLLAFWPALVVVSAGCVVYLVWDRAREPVRHRGRLLLQAIVGSAVLLALPGFVSAVADIA